MGDAERTGHGRVVAKFVGSPFLPSVSTGSRRSIHASYLQSHGCIGLHDMPHVLHQLADAAADLLRADADDHALWLTILRLLRALLVYR
jgi:hypothetical protein